MRERNRQPKNAETNEMGAVGEINEYLRLCDEALELAVAQGNRLRHAEIIIGRARLFFSYREVHPNYLLCSQRDMGRAEGILGEMDNNPQVEGLREQLSGLDADMAGLVYEVAEPTTITEPVWRPLEVVPQPTDTTLELPAVSDEFGWPPEKRDWEGLEPLHGAAGS